MQKKILPIVLQNQDIGRDRVVTQNFEICLRIEAAVENTLAEGETVSLVFPQLYLIHYGRWESRSGIGLDHFAMRVLLQITTEQTEISLDDKKY